MQATARQGPSPRRLLVLGLVLLVAVLGWASPGLVSSNDGSHLALGRAQVLRGETTLGDEVALTLWVDRARREGRNYSDRPPGTAWLAAPAIALGAALDPALLRASARAQALIVQPAAPRYAETYVARVQRQRQRAPTLASLQGTALMVAVHTAVVGALGVLGMLLLLRRRETPLPAAVFAAVAMGVGSLWGPYSTVLFSHVTAGALLVWAVFGLEVGMGSDGDDTGPGLRRAALIGAGAAAAAATSSDYLVGLLVLGLGVVTVPPRRWLAVAPWVLLGTAPIVVATLAYHHAAFGSVWSIGYDHHANFEFARSRGATFSGNVLRGWWSQWGAGQGAGVLVLAPVMLVGVAGLAAHRERRWLWGAIPWIVLLAMHRTPTGGAAQDHRYLVPLMPMLGVGLGLAWQRWASAGEHRRWVALGLVALAVGSGALAWSHVVAVWS